MTMMGTVTGHYIVFSDGTEKNVLEFFQADGYPNKADEAISRKHLHERQRKYLVSITVQEATAVLRDEDGFPIGEMT